MRVRWPFIMRETEPPPQRPGLGSKLSPSPVFIRLSVSTMGFVSAAAIGQQICGKNVIQRIFWPVAVAENWPLTFDWKTHTDFSTNIPNHLCIKCPFDIDSPTFHIRLENDRYHRRRWVLHTVGFRTDWHFHQVLFVIIKLTILNLNFN